MLITCFNLCLLYFAFLFSFFTIVSFTGRGWSRSLVIGFGAGVGAGIAWTEGKAAFQRK
jgi:hypothetical protein